MTKRLWTLFAEMFKISLCVVGGGFAIMAVADDVFSRRLRWTREGEILDHLPVFQMVPGIVACATAVYVGRKVAGVAGAVAAAAGVFLPSTIVFCSVCAGYALLPLDDPRLAAAFLGIRCSLTGIIAAMAARSWLNGAHGVAQAAGVVAALAAIGPLGINPALVIAVAALFGVAARLRGAGGGPLVFASSIWLFPLLFLKYGSIAFGGGYVLVPVYIADFVGPSAPYLNLSAHEFADVMALTQMTPGPVAVNCATFFGYRIGLGASGCAAWGIVCAVVSTLCLLAPGAILLYVALGSIDRFKRSLAVQGILAGVRPATVAMMLNALWSFAGMSLWTSGGGGAVEWHPLSAVLIAFAAWACRTRRVGIVPAIFICAAAALAWTLVAGSPP